MTMYIVEDTLGNIIRKFNTYKQALTFKTMTQRYDWRVIETTTTKRY